MYDLCVILFSVVIITLSGTVAAAITYLFVQFIFFPVLSWVLDHLASPVALFNWVLCEVRTHLWDLEEEQGRHAKTGDTIFAEWLQEKIAIQEGKMREVPLRG